MVKLKWHNKAFQKYHFTTLNVFKYLQPNRVVNLHPTQHNPDIPTI